MSNKEVINKSYYHNIDNNSTPISEDSIEDMFRLNQPSSLQSEVLISRLIEISEKKEEPKEKFVRKRNRSRSTLVNRTPPEIPKLETLPIIINRTRSNSDSHIKIENEKRSIFSFKLNNTKVDKCNMIINEFYEKMKNYHKQDLVTNLELLNLRFYIRSIEPKNIKIYDDEPTLTFIQRNQLALFHKDNVLYCKLYRSNKFIITNYEMKSYNRLIKIISSLPNKNNYCIYLENLNYHKDFNCDDINKANEILAAWDREKLFNHIIINDYVMNENHKLPKIKNSESIDKIKPKELLDKFWKTTITENLSNEEYLSKLENEYIELLVSSIIFLLREITNSEQIKYLQTILLNFYNKLTIIDPGNERLHYECAKYATFLELYIEAWDHIHKCTISLHSNKEDIIWLKQLKICYLCYLMKKSSRNDISVAKNYINVGYFTKMINDLEDEDLTHTLEVADHFLEGLIRLYYCDENSINNEINKWSYDIIFMLSCSSYCRSNIEKNNEQCLLTISQACLKSLIGKSYVINKNCLLQVSKTSVPYNALLSEISKNNIIIKIDILFDIAKISKNISKDELSENLYVKIFDLLCQVENLVSIKNYYDRFDDGALEYIIKKYIDNTTISLSLSEILINRKYSTSTYLLVLTYLMEKELFISSYQFITKSIKLIPNITDLEQKELLDRIENSYLEAQNYKKKLSESLLIVINTICNEEENSFIINNWINECFILSKNQYALMEKSKQLLKLCISKYILEDFKDMEKKEFGYKLYEFFGIAPFLETLWIPDKFLDPVKFVKSPVTSKLTSSLRKSNGNIIDMKMIESIKKMRLLGKSVEDIAFMYNIPLESIIKIVKDQ